MSEIQVTSSKKMGDVTHFMEGYFYVGFRLISISYFIIKFGEWEDMTLNEGDRQRRSSSSNFSYSIPKVTGWSGYRIFLTDTCPFVIIKTAGPLAPVLAQHKMWNWDPGGVTILGWEWWAHGMTPFSPAHPFISKKKPDKDRYMEPCPHAPITRNFPSGSSCEIVGDYVEK